MLRMWVADVSDRWDDFPQKPDPLAKMVLGALFDGDLLQGGVDAESAETSEDQILPGGVADGA